MKHQNLHKLIYPNEGILYIHLRYCLQGVFCIIRGKCLIMTSEKKKTEN